MVLKTKDLLTKGLTSELFLLAFIRPDSGYGLAQRLQDTKNKPDTSKTTYAIKGLTTAKYLKHNDDGKFFPNYTKLISEIQIELKLQNKSLDNNEKKILEFILKNSQFFGILSIDVIQKMVKQEKRVHRLDARKIICDKIGEWATICLFIQDNDSNLKKTISKINISSLKEIESIFNEINTVLTDVDKKLNKKMDQYMKNELKYVNLSKVEWEIIKDFRGFAGSLTAMIVFGFIPKKTLKKISLLWTERHGFNLGVKISMSKKLGKN